MMLTLPRTRVGRWTTGYRAFRVLVSNPADPVNGPLFQMCIERSLHQKLAARMRRTAEGSRLLRLRPRLHAETVSFEALERMPEGSFGHAFSRYFGEHAISPLKEAVAPAETDEDYVCTRLREAHDILHVVTGYGTDEIGEVELQCFNLGNMPWGPIPWITIFGAVLMGLSRKQGGFRPFFSRLFAAYQRGRMARCLADVIWEDHWDMPLPRLQQLLCAA